MQPDILSGRYLLEFLKPNQKQGAMMSQNVKKPKKRYYDVILIVMKFFSNHIDEVILPENFK